MNILNTNKEEYETQKTRKSECRDANQKLRANKNKDTYAEEGAKALGTKYLKVLYMRKHGNAPKVGQNKSQLLAVLNSARSNPSEEKCWITEDKSEQERLDSEIILLCDIE